MKRVTLILAALALMLGVGRAKATFVITFTQSGSNVAASGSGTLDILALTLAGSALNQNPEMNSSEGFIYLGTPGSDPNYYSGITGPAAFGGPTLLSVRLCKSL